MASARATSQDFHLHPPSVSLQQVFKGKSALLYKSSLCAVNPKLRCSIKTLIDAQTEPRARLVLVEAWYEVRDSCTPFPRHSKIQNKKKSLPISVYSVQCVVVVVSCCAITVYWAGAAMETSF